MGARERELPQVARIHSGSVRGHPIGAVGRRGRGEGGEPAREVTVFLDEPNEWRNTNRVLSRRQRKLKDPAPPGLGLSSHAIHSTTRYEIDKEEVEEVGIEGSFAWLRHLHHQVRGLFLVVNSRPLNCCFFGSGINFGCACEERKTATSCLLSSSYSHARTQGLPRFAPLLL